MEQPIDSIPHIDRTASEPRDPNSHYVELAKIDEINSTIRLLKLHTAEDGIKFLPGQWLDVYLPGVEQAGGFTITSTPAHAAPVTSRSNVQFNVDPSPVEQEQSNFLPYLELAVQRSPNKPAAWLWRPESEILGSRIAIRVGGSFVWPPASSVVPTQEIEKAVFIAGGVGINPLISMISHMHHTNALPPSVEFIYAAKLTDGEMLFVDRLLHIASSQVGRLKLKLFLTRPAAGSAETLQDSRLASLSISPAYRRMEFGDVLEALGHLNREKTVCLVCGPSKMTDEIVGFLRGQEGMSDDRVLCEKWW